MVKLGEYAYRIAIVVAGFAEDELTITHEANKLVVNGAKPENEEVQYLHQGLAL
ncbi:MAG: Hsp20 family protein, partial [Sinorhizobium fredii]|nr:Hsp20 family protein [Sinorhizobium fredii]